MQKTSGFFEAPKDLRKGERTRLRVLECAFLSIAREGYYRTTFQTIADRVGLSQPLIVRIFGSRETIFSTVAQHLLEKAIVQTEKRLQKVREKSVAKRLETYFEVSLEMVASDPDLAKFYMNLYYLATYDASTRKLISGIRSTAVNRIAGLLQTHETPKKSREHLELAESLHTFLVGTILHTIAVGDPWDTQKAVSKLRKHILKCIAL